MSKAIQGSCLCGQVTYRVEKSQGIFQYCQCSRCRKFTGSAFASNLLLKPEHFSWLSGAELVGRYEPEETKYFATCFCRNCGSSLPWMNKTGTVMVIPAGTLDQAPEAKLQHCIHTASRAEWYVDPAELPQYERLPKK